MASRVGRFLLLIVFLGALFLLGIAFFNSMLDRSLPVTQGEIQLSGLSAPVEIFRDSLDIPSVFASNENDAAFALGFLHAQERLFQMDIARRAAQGRLSELFGEKTLNIDKMFRTVNISFTAKEMWDAEDPKVKALFSAYSNGVNAFVSQEGVRLPVEFDILNYTPEPWTPINSFEIVRMMAWELNTTFYSDMTYIGILSKVPAELIQTFLPGAQIPITGFSPEFIPVVDSAADSVEIDSAAVEESMNQTDETSKESKKNNPDDTEKKPKEKDHKDNKEIEPPIKEQEPVQNPDNAPPDTGAAAFDFYKAYNDYRFQFGMEGSQIGSNSWAVSPSLSASGKPIIANDPHLAMFAPGKWYAVVVRGGAWNAEGVTLPGIPLIVIGKNKNIAWALTNVMADDTDFYLEQVNEQETHYFFENEWKPFFIRKDTIRVKGIDPVPFSIRFTHRGPIISPVHLFTQLHPNARDPKRLMSMQWLGSLPSREPSSFYTINMAQNAAEFERGVSLFSVPGQNFVFSDRSGNIGYFCGARVPVRNSNAPAILFDGTTGENDWKSFVPFAEMPRSLNPEEGFIATANTIPSELFEQYISYLYAPASRLTRISELLQGSSFVLEDMQRFQSDQFSPAAKRLIPFILRAFEGKKINDSNLQQSLKILDTWDFTMDAFLQSPVIYSAFLHFYLKNTLEDDFGKELLSEFCYISHSPFRVIDSLITQPENPLYDNKTTPLYETRDHIIRMSLVDALTYLENALGKDMTLWQWGIVHTVSINHFFNMEGIILKGDINIGPYGIGGDGTTINLSEYRMYREENEDSKKLFETDVLPSMRFLFDWSTPETFFLSLAGGQSGNPLSSHYSDFMKLWVEGKYAVIKTGDADLRSNTAERLLLQPK